MIVYLETYGCTANLNNAEIIEGLLKQRGFCVTKQEPKEKSNSIAILNTCIVKGPTLKRMERRISELSANYYAVIVTGCMPKIYGDRIKKMCNGKCICIAYDKIDKIPEIVEKIMEKKIQEVNKIINKPGTFVPLNVAKELKNKVIGITQISQGCTGRCAYCIVKHVKGKLKSFDEELIIKNIKDDLAKGCKEIWITSQDNACYGLDNGSYQLVKLLKRIVSIDKKFFLRIGMMNVQHLKHFIDELLDVMESKKIFKFLHLPVQSGSDKILEDMKREYKIREFLDIVKKFRKRFKYGVLATDIIVGFPTETEKDFEKTVEVIKKAKPEILNISRYWPMPKTYGALIWKEVMKKYGKTKQDLEKKAKDRVKKVVKVFEEIARNSNQRFMNENNVVECLVDKIGYNIGKMRTYLARDINYRLIVIASTKKLLGKFVKVRLQNATAYYIKGELLDNKIHRET